MFRKSKQFLRRLSNPKAFRGLRDSGIYEPEEIPLSDLSRTEIESDTPRLSRTLTATDSRGNAGRDIPIHSTPDEAIIRLVLQYLDLDTVSTDSFRSISPFPPSHAVAVSSRTSTALNHVISLTIPLRGSYILKIPLHGTPSQWRDGDAFNLRSEVGTMRYIKLHTMVPVPEVVAWDDGFDNEIGKPFVLMEKLDGVPADGIWLNRDGNGDFGAEDPSDTNYENREKIKRQQTPSIDGFEKRCVFLRSLASTMAELRVLDFDHIGSLNFDDPENLLPEIGPSCHWTATWNKDSDDGEVDKRVLFERPVFDSSKEFWEYALDKSFPRDAEIPLTKGLRRVFEMVFQCEPFTRSGIPQERKVKRDNEHASGVAGTSSRQVFHLSSTTPSARRSAHIATEPESFTLSHPALDLTNILVDPVSSQVTGILGWSHGLIVPRYIGYTRIPHFLCLDWEPSFTLTDAPHQIWTLDFYRRFYAYSMVAALHSTDDVESNGDGDMRDAIYTLKSPLYIAAYNAVYADGDALDFLRKVCGEIPDLRRADVREVVEWIGEGWDVGGRLLKGRLEGVFRPEAPDWRDADVLRGGGEGLVWEE